MKKKAKNVILSFMLGLLSICLCFAGIENPVVEQIAVYGNVRMKDSTVKRIMKIREGLPFEPDMIEVFQYRLERLGIFSHVSIESKTSMARVYPIKVLPTSPINIFAGGKLCQTNPRQLPPSNKLRISMSVLPTSQAM